MERRPRSRKKSLAQQLLPATAMGRLVLLAVLVLIISGIAIYVYRYAPTKEVLPLSEYYHTASEDEAVVILDGQLYETPEDASHGFAIVSIGDGEPSPYIELGFLKENLDNAYVYDAVEKQLRYTTDTDVISAALGDTSYSIGREASEMGKPIIIEENGTAYLLLEFVQQFTDLQYVLVEGEEATEGADAAPARLMLERAEYEKSVATLRKNTELRQFGGPKSKILEQGEKGSTVVVLENYGKWTKVISADGVIGCVKNKYLTEKESVITEATLPERSYQHILLDEKVCMGWHQVTSVAGNSSLDEAISNADSLNVVSPTWFYVADNGGGLADCASMDYVTACHNRGLQVWGLFSDFENPDVSTTALLNSTSSRDNLINNIIGKAVAYNMDGVNIDFEHVQEEAADGFLEFLRELSIKCENNDLVLSVDHYVPTEYRAYMDYGEQAKYVDYLIIMGYDEHYGGDTEAGSNASISFVTDAVETMLLSVDASQVILGMPFYTRVWVSEGDALTSSVLYMKKTYEYLGQHGAVATWSEELGQNYAEFVEDGKTYQVWVEDADSLAKKLSVIRDNGLGGGAFWKLTLESESIWSVISQYMQ